MARNKRNLTWLSAHFLNGMFPLPLTDIMYLLWITTGKIALVCISFSFPPSLSLSPRLSVFRAENALVRRRWILVRFSRGRDAARRSIPRTRFVVAGLYPQRYPLRAFHVAIPFNRLPLPAYVLLLRDNASLIVYISLFSRDNYRL